MLRSIIICQDQDLSDKLESIVSELGFVSVIRKLDRYPNSVDLARFLRAHAPHIVFLSIASMDKAQDIVTNIESYASGIQVVAMHRECEPKTLLEVMRIGIREFISMPFQRQAVVDTLRRVQEQIEKKPPAMESTDKLYSFLPSKAGVGATTIAVNAALALAKLSDMRVILSDFDLNCGIVRFMLKLDNAYSIIDAAEHAANVDENLWPQLVTSLGQLDVLHAGKVNPNYRIEHSQIRHLIDFMRRNYKAICVDLSGNMEKHSLELMQESKRVFLVCTPEIPSLHLAREKFNFLKSMDLDDRVAILLNRCQKRAAITPGQIEELLGAPVTLALPNDYQGVHRALTIGKQVDPASELGRQFTNLAHIMADRKINVVEQKKRLVEYFSLLPGRVSLLGETKKPA
jgi:pilus assembly protein CpaE